MTSTLLRIITLLTCGVILLWSACKKPTLDDSGLLPDEGLFFTVTDTVSLKTVTIQDLPALADSLSVNIWGAMADPVFGQKTGGIYANFTLDRTNVDLGANLTLDSLVLTLRYSSGTFNYGDITVPQKMLIYRMTESIRSDTSYTTEATFATETTPVGEVMGFVPASDDSLRISGLKIDRGINIRLDDALGQEFLDQSGGTNLASDAAFKAWFNGLYIAPDTANPGKGMTYFDLYSTNSRLTLYYNDTSSIGFLINNNSRTVNHFSHNYTGAEVDGKISDNNDSTMYVQAMAGPAGRIFFPTLPNLGNVAINKAELTVTILNNDTITYRPPAQMTVTKVLADGTDNIIPDQLVTEGFFGGVKTVGIDTATGATVQQYKFNIPRYCQSIVNGDTDYGINLLTFPTVRQVNRVVVGGAEHSQYPAKLKLVYTKID